jgi:hypothetical protein
MFLVAAGLLSVLALVLVSLSSQVEVQLLFPNKNKDVNHPNH